MSEKIPDKCIEKMSLPQDLLEPVLVKLPASSLIRQLAVSPYKLRMMSDIAAAYHSDLMIFTGDHDIPKVLLRSCFMLNLENICFSL